MRAAVYDRYGAPEVVHIEERDEPGIGPDEVLVRVEATVVGASESAARSGRPWFARLYFGVGKPKFPVLGTDFAGIVERVGDRVGRFSPGDLVFGAVGTEFGAHAELVKVAEHHVIAHVPPGLDAAEAVSSIDGFLTALPFLRDVARVRAGQAVLVNGASGTVGSAAVQLAKHLGATVVGVCSAAHAPLVASLGADRVIDHTREDFTAVRGAYDVIFDAVGKRTFRQCRAALADDGIYLTTVPSAAILVQMPLTRLLRRRRRAAIAFTGLREETVKAGELALLVELLETGGLVPVIDRIVPFEDIVEAHRRVDGGHKAGSVVVALSPALRPTEAAS
ncbi:NADPH:quinone reductase-like Zn-dependent oxidoreductase [Agromyces ramosus]|uniref:NADPH:quinone reductase-like Zn-dependent oxidoreductase n=1 Tax=Agromyces ramosus TaxID=33879 RepID=A0A4V2EZ87_9MICO|nr:NAD(P)-dependent alcohol dehydrogenase [Agromyces ramosus]RZS65630.1 NADPH:quinone reductase-like Zn-dependent oxidoreductase [Agromyces ramosus]